MQTQMQTAKQSKENANMSFGEKVDAANERMVQISKVLDNDKESARLQGSGLAGMLLGVWIVATAFSLGFNPVTVAIMTTIGVGTGIAAIVMS